MYEISGFDNQNYLSIETNGQVIFDLDGRDIEGYIKTHSFDVKVYYDVSPDVFIDYTFEVNELI